MKHENQAADSFRRTVADTGYRIKTQERNPVLLAT